MDILMFFAVICCATLMTWITLEDSIEEDERHDEKW